MARFAFLSLIFLSSCFFDSKSDPRPAQAIVKEPSDTENTYEYPPSSDIPNPKEDIINGEDDSAEILNLINED